MKLPEYDNRTPNTLLYQDTSKSSDWESIKFTVQGFGLLALVIGCFGAALYMLLAFIRNLLH